LGRLLAQLVGTLLLVGLVLHFIWWLVAGAVVVGGFGDCSVAPPVDRRDWA
jgi:hypothetical protein